MEHVTPFSNPWGVPLFGGTFFALTGLHMTHVIIGLIYLGIIARPWRAANSKPRTWKSAASTGTSSTWCGCSSSRWST